MPSQSSLEGKSTPDQWIVTGSPDSERVVLEREMETWEESDGLKKMRDRRRRMGEIGGFIFLFGFLFVFCSVVEMVVVI